MKTIFEMAVNCHMRICGITYVQVINDILALQEKIPSVKVLITNAPLSMYHVCIGTHEPAFVHDAFGAVFVAILKKDVHIPKLGNQRKAAREWHSTSKIDVYTSISVTHAII
jgi:hypothetical protein